MRHRREYMIFQPLALGEHALLMTARAEVSGLAGVGKQVVMTTLIVIEAGKAMMQIATGEETLEDFGLDRPMDEAGGIEFRAMSTNTLIERTCPWVCASGRTPPAGRRASRAHDRLPEDVELVC